MKISKVSVDLGCLNFNQSLVDTIGIEGDEMMFQAENPVISNNMMENKSTTFVSTTLKIVIFDRSVSTLSLDPLFDLVYAHLQKQF